MVILDNSGSMHNFAYKEREVNYVYSGNTYRASAGYVPATTYYGYFNSKSYYSYDSANNYFEEDSSGAWYGNFLNWLTMKRSDVAKKVLTGGRSETAGDGSTVLAGEKPDDGTEDRGEYKVYNDTNAVSDLDAATKHMSPFAQKWAMRINTSFDTAPAPQVPSVRFYQTNTVVNEGQGRSNGEVWTRTNSTALSAGGVSVFYLRVKVNSTPSGLVQKAGEKIRFGLTIYDNDGSYDNGGEVLQPVGTSTTNVVTSINNIYPTTWTPRAETLYTVVRYFAKKARYFETDEYTIADHTAHTNQHWDPFYFTDRSDFVPCSEAFVILITDGESTQDLNIPNNAGVLPNDSNLRDYDGDGRDPGTYDSSGSDYLDDVAYYAHKNDLRTDLEGVQNLTLYTIFAFGSGADLLRDAAINGSFVDANGDGRPNTDAEETAASAGKKEWDWNADGVPDNYAAAPSGQQLEEALLLAIESILSRISSGTAASVISNTRSGEGAVYQAVFYPQYEDSDLNKTKWVGQVHSLFLDDYGNMREDTNGNARLDVCKDADTTKCPDGSDLIIVYKVLGDGSTTVYKYRDVNGNGKLEDTEDDTPAGTCEIKDIKYVWNTSKWLNEISNTDIVTQRVYANKEQKRYVFTTVDANADGIPDSTVHFDCVSEPTAADLTDTTGFYAYLHTHAPFTTPNASLGIAPADYAGFRTRQTQRVIDYIRGLDLAGETEGSSTIPTFRSRKTDYDGDGTLETWRLGDIVHSTPTVVAKPAENFDLLYKDSSYTAFYKKYKNRRTVIYTGANDGMIHAFNGGFYDTKNKKFAKKLTTQTEHDLGSELWAYVPFNLLPHLYWLTDPNYSHVYYMDLKPRIFDARIFPVDTDHPNGWGTVLVCGMRFGGGVVNADIDKDDILDATDPSMRSSYVIMDITNPEVAPKVLAEVSFDELGFTTSYPTVLLTTEKDGSGGITDQNWHLVFGSGPIDDAEGAGSDALTSVTSTKTAKIFMVDLEQLTTASPSVSKLAATGQDYFVELDAASFVSDPVSVDYDLDYSADALYFGTVAGNLTAGWGGKLRRIVIDGELSTSTAIDPLDPDSWDADSTLIDLTSAHDGQPIVAAPSIAQDNNGRFWVYFGTGRFFNRDDATGSRASDQQSFYGIKEPIDTSKKLTWATVPYSTSSLMDVSDATVMGSTTAVSGVTGLSDLDSDGTTDFDDLVTAVGTANGWFMDFPDTGERNLGQATVFGEIVAFTTYTPSADYCTYEGTSKFCALYYKTGSAYKKSVMGLNSDGTVKKSLNLGQGLSITPNIHTGSEEGSKAYVQQSTGAIQSIEQNNPGVVKSGFVSWKEE
jgi:type IV pilus assembly protein PilY1